MKSIAFKLLLQSKYKYYQQNVIKVSEVKVLSLRYVFEPQQLFERNYLSSLVELLTTCRHLKHDEETKLDIF